MNLSFKVTRDTLTPELREKLRQVKNPRPIAAALGKCLEVELIRTFRQFQTERPNAMGWPSANFWVRKVAQKTALTEVHDKFAVVTVASPEFIHRLEGGTIYPTAPRTTLAIPANAEAYKMGGPKASGADLQFLLLAQGNLVGALLKKTGQTKKGDLTGGQIMYWLVRSVNQKAHPDEDPGKNQTVVARISSALGRTLASAIGRVMGKHG